MVNAKCCRKTTPGSCICYPRSITVSVVIVAIAVQYCHFCPTNRATLDSLRVQQQYVGLLQVLLIVKLRHCTVALPVLPAMFLGRSSLSLLRASPIATHKTQRRPNVSLSCSPKTCCHTSLQVLRMIVYDLPQSMILIPLHYYSQYSTNVIEL